MSATEQHKRGVNSGRLRQMAEIAMLSAVLCVVSPFTIPVGAVPISLSTLCVYLMGASCGRRRATTAVLVYLLLGCIGVPVFAGFTGGVAHLLAPSGGFLLGYVVCALAEGWLVDRFCSKRLIYPVGIVVGMLCCFAVGTVWFALLTGTNLTGTVAVCVLPFLPIEAAKIVIASLAAPKVRKAVDSISK